MAPFFTLWVVITHFLNIVFLLLLARSGLEVLSAFPKLYWNDDYPPGREWAQFSKKMYGADSRRLWTSLDEEEAWSPVIALPGRKNLGLSRHWHFMSVQFWILTGVVYLALVFTSGYWLYLIPTRWSLVPDAIKAVGTYLQFRLPENIPGQPFEPAQKLTYFLVIFLLAPFQIATGAAMSPSVLARFPRYGKLFGGKQGARSLHILGLCAFAAFTALHTLMVIIHGVPDELAKIVLGDPEGSRRLALGLGLTGIFLILLFHIMISWFSLRYRRCTQRLLGFMVDPFERVISRWAMSKLRFRHSDISPYHRVNGYPPTGADYQQMAAEGFQDYRLDIGGLVEHPVSLTLVQLRNLGWQDQIVKHHCIQGWRAIAQWGGVPFTDLLTLVHPKPEASPSSSTRWTTKASLKGRAAPGSTTTRSPLRWRAPRRPFWHWK